MLFKIIVLKKFTNSTEKHLGVFFNKVAGPQNSNFIKKRLQHRFFPAKFVKCLRTPCFTDHFHRLFPPVWGFQPANLFGLRLRQRCFSVNFAKSLRTSFDRTWLFLVFIWEFWEVFQNSEKLLISCKVAGFQPPNTVKNYFKSVFQVYERLLLRPVVSPEVSFLIIYTCGSVSLQFRLPILPLLLILLMLLIRSSRLVVFCKKGVLMNFALESHF